ncbi:aspartate/glutamate racemase family protein [Xanthobacter autotrophicus]|uniref:aspartate/glutamate racemase family protein n=1 Tax=Xanthobacter autotrophicus TaxID=280 RepID=UPI0037268759
MTTILLINPNTSTRSTEMMLSVAGPLLPHDVTLRGMTATTGAAMIVDEAALAEAADEVVRIGLAEASRINAVIVSAFGNPGVGSLRALLRVPVIGIGEAAILKAAATGSRFGIATTTPDLVRSIEAGVRDLGLQGQFTGVRVPDGDPLSLAADPPAQDQALAAAATACIEQDGADAVVIGGGPLSDAAARLRLRFPSRIVEPVPAAIEKILRQVSSQCG